VTFSQAVDVLLAGGRAGVPLGVPLGRVTELVGAPGVGKTQMAMQLALDVQLPAELGGCAGAAVYLDAEGGASPWRLRAMAAAVEAHMARFVEKRGNDPALRRACSADALMANVLLAHGVRRGDSVTVYMPTCPDLAFVMLACARIGAMHSVVFAGFSAEALGDRILDAASKWVVTANEGKRGGRGILPLLRSGQLQRQRRVQLR
jgi:RecA/RadA recombinase